MSFPLSMSMLSTRSRVRFPDRANWVFLSGNFPEKDSLLSCGGSSGVYGKQVMFVIRNYFGYTYARLRPRRNKYITRGVGIY